MIYRLLPVVAAVGMIAGCQYSVPTDPRPENSSPISGRIVRSDGRTPAVGVTALLRSKNTLAKIERGESSGAPDSEFTATTTDSGEYAFEVLPDTGMYVVEAVEKDEALLIDSLVISPGVASITLPTDTIKQAGAIKGRVTVPSGENEADIYILAFGIDRFSQADTEGTFCFSPLAEGNYTLRIMSTDENCALFDTSGIRVTSGDTTDIGNLELSCSHVSIPKNLTVHYDSNFQVVHLSWDPVQESSIDGYMVFRQLMTPKSAKMKIVNNSPVTGTTFTDYSAQQDSVYAYQVATYTTETGETGLKGEPVTVTVLSIVAHAGCTAPNAVSNATPDIVSLFLNKVMATEPVCFDMSFMINPPSIDWFRFRLDILDRVTRFCIMSISRYACLPDDGRL